MYFSRLLLYFFMIFFSMQLFFGEAGVIAFIQKKTSTTEYHSNVVELLKINSYLNEQIALNKNNKSFLLMNAHRVGLLADDEYLIKLDTPLFFDSVIYSPGKVVLKENNFYFSNILLFITSLIMILCLISFKLTKAYFVLGDNKQSRREHKAHQQYQSKVSKTSYEKNINGIQDMETHTESEHRKMYGISAADYMTQNTHQNTNTPHSNKAPISNSPEYINDEHYITV